MSHLLAFAAVLFAFAALDVAWLLLIGGSFFKAQVGPILRDQPNLIAAAAFYLIYAVGQVVLVVAPAIRDSSAAAAAWRGALLGLVAYATFDLSMLAIIKGWTLTAAIVDMTWGTIATAVSCLIGYQVAHRAPAARS